MTEPQIAEEPRDDDAYALSERLVPDLRLALATSNADRVRALFEPLHPADVADVVEQITPPERRELLVLTPELFDGEVLSELDESLREDVIEFLPQKALSDAVRELDSDDVVDILEDLEEPQQEALLDALEEVERAAVEIALSYPEDSAGRLMQREVVTAPAHWTVGQAIDHLRNSDHLPEHFYHVILVDPRHRPIGHVTLGKLMSSKRDVPLADIQEEVFQTIPADQDEGEVAYAFNQYHLISAPVVDADDRLVGVITIDDAMAVLDEEHEEDILRLSGVGDESLTDDPLQIARQRFPWLGVNLLTAILASIVISLFEGALQAVVALAVLMPIVASMGGNAGTQSLAVAVRALATKDLTASNALRVVRREAIAGLINGLAFAVIMGGLAALWYGNPALGGVIAAAMVINLIVAALSGVLVPLLLERAGKDPALASGTFVTTVTDVVGFFAFLGLATIVLL